MLRSILHTFVIVLSLIATSSAFGQEVGEKDLTADQVKNSIRRAVRYLKDSQNADTGRWPKYRFDGDVTTLATLALLNAGVSPQDPQIKKSISQILNIKEDNLRTYVVAMRIMALASADPAGKLYRRDIANDVRWLLQRQVKKGRYRGGWYYGLDGMDQNADSSNSQFVVLALHEASRLGIEVPQENWELAQTYWKNCFRGTGFAYSVSSGSVTGSMTCAGITSWIIIQENLADVNKELPDGKVVCCGAEEALDPVDKAFEWLAAHFTVSGNPVGRNGKDSVTKFYYLYGLERAGRLSGRRFIGVHDWYRMGAAHFVDRQYLDGSWLGSSRFGEGNSNIATSFALLFLSKGKRPVVIRKLRHGMGDDWDRHPKGVHQITRKIEIQWDENLTWQTVDLLKKDITVNDLLGGVVFISGRDSLNLSNSQKDLLKKCIENGGFIFAEACQGNGCGNDVKFDRDFRTLVSELFPGNQLEPLGRDHPVWDAHFPMVPNKDWPLLGLQASCRTSIIYCPANLTCHWRLDRPHLFEKLPGNVATDVEYARKVGVNVISYATGRQLRDKLDTPEVIEDNGDALSDRILVLPKLLHKGGADEAPNAWRNVLTQARTAAGLRINLEKKLIGANFELMADHPFIFMHGRSDFFFTEEQRAAIKQYIEMSKGFILVDSICASEKFNEAFRREMKAIFPDKPLTAIPANHPLWTDERFGDPLKSVKLRIPDPKAPGGFREQLTHPLFESITVDERFAIVYSPYDLSCALENTTVSQCAGYPRRDAAIMGIKILLYRLMRD